MQISSIFLNIATFYRTIIRTYVRCVDNNLPFEMNAYRLCRRKYCHLCWICWKPSNYWGNLGISMIMSRSWLELKAIDDMCSDVLLSTIVNWSSFGGKLLLHPKLWMELRFIHEKADGCANGWRRRHSPLKRVSCARLLCARLELVVYASIQDAGARSSQQRNHQWT